MKYLIFSLFVFIHLMAIFGDFLLFGVVLFLITYETNLNTYILFCLLSLFAISTWKRNGGFDTFNPTIIKLYYSTVKESIKGIK